MYTANEFRLLLSSETVQYVLTSSYEMKPRHNPHPARAFRQVYCVNRSVAAVLEIVSAPLDEAGEEGGHVSHYAIPHEGTHARTS